MEPTILKIWWYTQPLGHGHQSINRGIDAPICRDSHHEIDLYYGTIYTRENDDEPMDWQENHICLWLETGLCPQMCSNI